VTFITKHFPGRVRQSLGRKYSVLIETAPDIATECGVSAGIHTARSGGTTQTPCFVRSVITPLEANSSWSSGCECSGHKWPCATSADTLAISPSSRPFGAWSILWHSCDISCHNIERIRALQVLCRTGILACLSYRWKAQ